MLDTATIDAFAFDMAGSNASYEMQDELAMVVGALLDHEYQIVLFSSNQKDDLGRENFFHSRVTFHTDPLPPPDGALPDLLRSPGTLWVTEAPELQAWLIKHGHALASRAEWAEPAARVLRIASLRELSTIFDPMGRVFHELVPRLAHMREERRARPFLVGVGGPPLSGFQQFTVALKDHLEAAGFPIVDLLDLSAFLNGTSTDEAPAEIDGPWKAPAAGEWLVETVLRPLSAGGRVFLESLPDIVPGPFAAHLPLYLSEESIVLTLGELVCIEPVAAHLDASIVLEVSPRETARRMYEIPETESFDEKFVNQYMTREGAAYQAYLAAYDVARRATFRVNAERPHAFALISGDTH